MSDLAPEKLDELERLETRVAALEAKLDRVREIRDTWDANSDKYKLLHVADVVADLDRALSSERDANYAGNRRG